MKARLHRCRRFAVLFGLQALAVFGGQAWGADGQMTWAVHVSLAPTWLDPAETPGIITPFMLMYALHDGMAKAMPDNSMAPGLATSSCPASPSPCRRGART